MAAKRIVTESHKASPQEVQIGQKITEDVWTEFGLKAMRLSVNRVVSKRELLTVWLRFIVTVPDEFDDVLLSAFGSPRTQKAYEPEIREVGKLLLDGARSVFQRPPL